MVLKLCHGDRLLKDENDLLHQPDSSRKSVKNMANQWHQVALRYLIQRNIIVIPKSTHKETYD